MKHNRPVGGVLHLSLPDTQRAADNSPPRREGEFRPVADPMRVGQMFTFLGMTTVVDGDLAEGEFRWKTDEPAPWWPRWIAQAHAFTQVINESLIAPVSLCGDRGETAHIRPGTHYCLLMAHPPHNIHRCNCGQHWGPGCPSCDGVL